MAEDRITLERALADLNVGAGDTSEAEIASGPERETTADIQDVDDRAARVEAPEVGDETPEVAEAEAEPFEPDLEEQLPKLEDEEEGPSEAEEEAPSGVALELTTATGDAVTIELETDDPATRAALENLQNDAARVRDMDRLYQHVREQAEQNMENAAELQYIEDELRLDPMGYIIEKVHPSVRTKLAIELLHDDVVLQAVEDQLERWMQDPVKRREAAAELRVERMERRDQIKRRREVELTERQNARTLFDKIMSLTPSEMDHRTAQMWQRDALMEVHEYVRRNDIKTLDPDRLPDILAARMQLYGIGNNARLKRAEPTDEAALQLAEKAKQMPDRVKRAAARRRTAASSPAGAGAIPGRISLKKGATLDDALAELRKRVRQ